MEQPTCRHPLPAVGRCAAAADAQAHAHAPGHGAEGAAEAGRCMRTGRDLEASRLLLAALGRRRLPLD